MLEFAGSLVAQRRVFAVRVVVAFDVFEELGAGVFLGVETPVLQHLVLQGSNERLGPCVVVWVGAGGHTLLKTGVGERLPIDLAPVLTTSIAVEIGLLGPGPTIAEGLIERGCHEA